MTKRSSHRLAKRLALAASAALLAALLAEGAWSIYSGWSLLRRATGVEATELTLRWSDERSAADVGEGVYRRHPDPRVGYALQPNADLTVLEVPVRSDGLGLRGRSAPPVAGPQLRVAVLGDSVAFGMGLTEEATFGARLEALLNEARDPTAPPVVCRTVAVPGWNYRNSIAFLFDHFAELRPDLVLFLPIENDLDDTSWPLPVPQEPDPASRYPWVWTTSTSTLLAESGIARRLKREGRPLPTRGMLGSPAVLADLTPESSRRYDDMADWLGRLDERMAQAGGRLILLHVLDSRFMITLRERLERRHLRPPVVHLLGRVTPADTLGWNAHPNGDTMRYFAIWTARALLAGGYVPRGAGEVRGEVPRQFSARRSPAREPSEYVRLAAAERVKAERGLARAIDADGGGGIRQLFGGLGALGLVGPGLLAVLPAGCRALEVVAEPLADPADAPPVSIEVRAGGRELGRFTVGGAGSPGAPRGRATHRFELPSEVASRPFEVELAASDWVVVRGPDRPLLASFRLHALRCAG